VPVLDEAGMLALLAAPTPTGPGAMNRKPVIGLALGSGSARGWAHIGVIRALQQAGIQPDLVCGASIGAVVGAAYALGELDRFEQWARGLTGRTMFSFMDFKLAGGMLKGERVIEFFRSRFSDRPIEALDIPFAAVATGLHSGSEVWLRTGSTADAVRASMALPGLFTPAQREGRLLVDGGLVNPVPVSLARAMGADIVIAVDLNADILGRHLQPLAVVRDARAPAAAARKAAVAAQPALGADGGRAGAAAVCAGADPVHAGHPRHPQGQDGAAGAVGGGRWQAAGRIPLGEPRVGAARRDCPAGGGRADRHRGPPLLRALGPGLAAHGVGGGAHAGGRQAGRLHHHAAAGAQPVPRGHWPRAHAHAQAQGGHHGAEDRGAVLQGRDPGDLPEHGALSLQRLRHRDGGAHLFRQVGRPAQRAGERHADRHAQGHGLLQPGAQPRARPGPAQHRAGADEEARQAGRGGIRRAQQAPAAHPLRAPGGNGRPRAALGAAVAQAAHRLGRPQRLQPVCRRAGDPHHHRLPPAAAGQPGRGAPGQGAAGRGRRGLGRAQRLEPQEPAGAGNWCANRRATKPPWPRARRPRMR
jgi:predicted acylesterase/phospholipase RssA